MEKLRGIEVLRRVDRTGEVSLWGRGVRVGKGAAGQGVRIRFNGEGDLIRIIVRDEWGRVFKERVLEWLTEEELWAGLEEEGSNESCQTYV